MNLKREGSSYKRTGLVNLEPSDSCGVGLIASVDGTPSRRILELGLTSLANVAHRGAIGADNVTGDGAGISTSLPRKLIERWLRDLQVDSIPHHVGVGVLFLPDDPAKSEIATWLVCRCIASIGLAVLGTRDVPVNKYVLGRRAEQSRPKIRQVFIASRQNDPDEFERELFLARRAIELTPQEQGLEDLYVASMSCRTMAYKAMVLSTSVAEFYPDLQDPDYDCNVCIFHQRFSTNTMPKWSLCQPFRMLAHNGEINTIRGNRNWLASRECSFRFPAWNNHRHLVQRLVNFHDSDSGSLDNMLEILTLSGRSILHAMSMIIPPAWQNDPRITDDQRAFFEYHSCFCEPWDGPAAVAMTDGKMVAACLDRNGLRPARYKLTSDNILIVGSEVGSERIDDQSVVRKGRLAPGQMIAVDMVGRQLLLDHEIKAQLAAHRPWRQWLIDEAFHFDSAPETSAVPLEELDKETLCRHQVAAGVTREEIEMGISNMAQTGKEPTYSMGVDTPLAVLSKQPRQLTDYFKQRFAQVTNPPIDPIRERLVMSTAASLGPERNLLAEGPLQCRVFGLDSAILKPGELHEVIRQCPFQTSRIDCTWDRKEGSGGLRKALTRLASDAQIAVDCHASVLLLSDRNVSADRVAVPMLLAAGAIHRALQVSGQRMMCSMIAETSEVRDSHQLALLFGYGATAVYPYLGYMTVRDLKQVKNWQKETATLWDQYHTALTNGLLKIMSKMGISILNSYQGAQIFEALGIGDEVMETCFKYSYSNIGGIGFEDIARDCLARHDVAFQTPADKLTVFDMGIAKPRRTGEQHVINGKVTKTFHQFVREGRATEYLKFQEHVAPDSPIALRDLLEFRPKMTGSIPLSKVESIESIRRRFTTAAMSLGAISPEAHEAIAIAMNTIGGKSNSGEGGEDRQRRFPREDGTLAQSRIRQIASGRFGVDAEYLRYASEVEIKMAQGAKPGEGGQLPGFKVNRMIARLRNTEPGVTLISPPPHHDIYSIEDIAQLILDLKMVNPATRVCVKLVAKTGVGGIAIGVAKAHADSVLISGHEGGTGASPVTSIQHAGSPWELGLSETHQSLVASSLRDRIVLRVDGGLRTGRDVVKAAILGAEEYNFGTMALIALGCVYVKKCHLNNCPVGIATQDPRYREKFKGKPENLIRYLNAVAQECREILAELGVCSIDEVIGQTQYLEATTDPTNPKTENLVLDPLLFKPDKPGKAAVTTDEKYSGNQKLFACFDDRIIADLPTDLAGDVSYQGDFKIVNTDRNIGTRLSGVIAEQFGKDSLPDDTIQLTLRGSAGQSLGAFLCSGIALKVLGEANDYVGKGMCGGEIVLRPPESATYSGHENVIAGNTLLYGATGGKLFAAGLVAERFCVRNSGAIAVVEGCGDHGCEYMTRGTAVILGPVGNNFGAGMTGGSAFVYDPEDQLETLANPETIEISQPDEASLANVRELIAEFSTRTESVLAQRLLDHWSQEVCHFRHVHPHTSDTTAPELQSGLTQKDDATTGS